MNEENNDTIESIETEIELNPVVQLGVTNSSYQSLRNSVEINQLFSAFADAQKNAILRVMSVKDETERNALAARIADEVSLQNSRNSGKCPAGTKFNPLTGDCDPA